MEVRWRGRGRAGRGRAGQCLSVGLSSADDAEVSDTDR